MTISNPVRFIRKPAVLDRLSLSKSTLHERINEGLLPPGIPLSNRATAWLEHEIEIVMRAIAAGQSNEQLVKLVQQIVNSRKEDFQRLM